MAAEIGLLSLTQLQKLAENQQQQQQQLNPSFAAAAGLWMWNPKEKQEDDDSWEVRAFAEDTGNVMGTTWPPRSYTCTFCRREFRSAQALGGHMNVHRRDRARLHQTQPLPPPGGSNNHHHPTTSSSTTSSSSTLLIPTQEFATNGGLCLLYQISNPSNGVYTTTPAMMNSTIESPSTLLSISPYLPANMMSPPNCRPPSVNYPVVAPSDDYKFSINHPTKAEITITSNGDKSGSTNNSKQNLAVEELDLELRLGH